MKTFIFEPHRGIRNSVQFGMTRAAVHASLSPEEAHPFSRGQTAVDAFHESSFQVSYDTEGTVEFIEFARGAHVLLNDYDLLGAEAEAVIEHLRTVHELDADDPEPGYSYTFPSIELGLWRPVIPEDEFDDEGRYFESAGFGRLGYYSMKNG